MVYVDNDPLVLAHARALLTSSRQGRTAFIQADLRDPAAILDDPVTREVLDFGQPIALMLVAVLHFMPDEFNPARSVATLVDALPSGSYVVASHVSGEHFDPAGASEESARTTAAGCRCGCGSPASSPSSRSATWNWCRPVSCSCRWRPGGGDRAPPAEVNFYGGVARKRYAVFFFREVFF